MAVDPPRRCSINGESGAVEVRVPYLEGEEPPPDLCDACDEARRPPVPAARRRPARRLPQLLPV